MYGTCVHVQSLANVTMIVSSRVYHLAVPILQEAAVSWHVVNSCVAVLCRYVIQVHVLITWTGRVLSGCSLPGAKITYMPVCMDWMATVPGVSAYMACIMYEYICGSCIHV